MSKAEFMRAPGAALIRLYALMALMAAVLATPTLARAAEPGVYVQLKTGELIRLREEFLPGSAYDVKFRRRDGRPGEFSAYAFRPDEAAQLPVFAMSDIASFIVRSSPDGPRLRIGHVSYLTRVKEYATDIYTASKDMFSSFSDADFAHAIMAESREDEIDRLRETEIDSLTYGYVPRQTVFMSNNWIRDHESKQKIQIVGQILMISEYRRFNGKWQESPLPRYYPFVATESANNLLWTAHKNRFYPGPDRVYETLARKLADASDYVGNLDTVAQLYADGGDAQAALGLYETRILPRLPDYNEKTRKSYRGLYNALRKRLGRSPVSTPASSTYWPRVYAYKEKGGTVRLQSIDRALSGPVLKVRPTSMNGKAHSVAYLPLDTIADHPVLDDKTLAGLFVRKDGSTRSVKLVEARSLATVGPYLGRDYKGERQGGYHTHDLVTTRGTAKLDKMQVTTIPEGHVEITGVGLGRGVTPSANAQHFISRAGFVMTVRTDGNSGPVTRRYMLLTLSSLNAQVWEMHESRTYGQDRRTYEKLTRKLAAATDEIGYLDTAAQALADLSLRDEALAIYEARILPISDKSAKDRDKFRRYYEKLKAR
ncbi:hypothetical protein [Oricola sp.]|uniref:hypothetical protein n=1 Tax=Oricola sp. TaxID=1979950 RepID=UPI0025D25647|nr:hypothetical protein [Oricola sp.]MCI5073522.1 hypothetical protein [Oricola sp.]